MTCASCVRRVEKGHRRSARRGRRRVNLATERAEVRFDGAPDLAAVFGAVGQAGYGVGTEATDLAVRA